MERLPMFVIRRTNIVKCPYQAKKISRVSPIILKIPGTFYRELEKSQNSYRTTKKNLQIANNSENTWKDCRTLGDNDGKLVAPEIKAHTPPS